MSKLYIRVMTGFYTHRKTTYLRSLIGNDALWIVPRLWAYAAENQPDGNMSLYTSEMLASLLGYASSNASGMLQALKQAGFIDSEGPTKGYIHDWKQHNSYHETYSNRAKIAANARWNRENSPTPPQEQEIGKGKEERGASIAWGNASSITPEIPSETEVVSYGAGGVGIPADYCRHYHETREIKNSWVSNGRLIDWRRDIKKWWEGDKGNAKWKPKPSLNISQNVVVFDREKLMKEIA